MKKTVSATILFVVLGCSRSAPVAEPQRSTGTVTIQITVSGDMQSIQLPNIATGTTLETVMRLIEEVPVKVDGSGTTAFIDKIGDQATNSADGWTFKVDGEHANQGIGGTVLTPPTTVTWSFGEY